MDMNDKNDIWPEISEALKQYGIEFRIGTGGDSDPADCTVMCLTGDMKTTVAEMARTARDQVVMVRIDEGTKTALDDWVETGAVKSRSEAAALFMREGIKVRSAELAQLREALDEVGRARQRLEEKAKQVIGAIPDSDVTD
jgi:Arc/MetJ-type ribon-helix-helix transcriptional regulator